MRYRYTVSLSRGDTLQSASPNTQGEAFALAREHVRSLKEAGVAVKRTAEGDFESVWSGADGSMVVLRKEEVAEDSVASPEPKVAVLPAPKPEVLPASPEALERSVLYLSQMDPDRAGVLNGVGWNGADSQFGHELARQVASGKHLSGRQLQFAWKMCRKYHGQLSGIGVDILSMAEPEVALQHSLTFERRPEGPVAVFEFDGKPVYGTPAYEQLTWVKSLPVRRFSPDPRPQWVSPVGSVEDVRKFTEWANSNGWSVTVDPAFAVEAAALPQSGPVARLFVRLHGGIQEAVFVFTAPPSWETRNAIKALPGWHFDGDSKEWTVPVSRYAAEIVEIGRKAGLQVDPELERLVRNTDIAADFLRQLSMATEPVPNIPLKLNGVAPWLTARPFQLAGVQYAVTQKRTWIGDDMGLGKTIESILAVNELGAFPSLVTCNASKVIDWAREILGVLPGRTVSVVNGSEYDMVIKDVRGRGDVTIRTNNLKADFVICSRSILVKNTERLMKVNFGSHLIDESQRVKNEDTGWSQATEAITSGELPKRDARGREIMKDVVAPDGKVRKVRDLAIKSRSIEVVFELTGTAAKSRPFELVNQLRIMRRLEDFGGFWPFVKRYCAAYKGDYAWDFGGASNLEELHKRMRETCYVQRDKRVVMPQLPAKQRTPSVVELSNRATYAEAARDLIGWLADNVSSEAARRASRAEQIVTITRLKSLAALGKIEAAKAWVEEFLESGEKLILFADHIEVQKALAEAFPGCVWIAGGEDSLVRDGKVQKFQNDPECRLAVVSLMSGGEGLTLTAASNVAFLEFGWTPSDHEQAEDRCYGRVNDPHGANCWYLIAKDTVDEDIVGLLQSKWDVVSRINRGHAADENTQMLEKVRSANILDELVDRLVAKASGN